MTANFIGDEAKDNAEHHFGINWRILNVVHNPLMGWFVLAASVTITVVAFLYANHFAEAQARTRFDARVDEIANAIHERLGIYEQVLRSGAAMMYSKESVSRTDWRQFVDTLDLSNHWPGIQGLGFAIPLEPDELEAHVQSIRVEGFPDYAVKPQGPREEYTAIIYLEPFDWRNQRAFGYDMWSNASRRKAMNRAIETGDAATSGRITLVQETDTDVQFGFLTYLPVYASKTIPPTVEMRQQELQGWVYAAFRVGDLMQGILGEKDANIEFEIYDGEGVDKDKLLFDSNGHLHSDEVEYQPRFSQTTAMTLQGQPWTIYFNTPEDMLLSFSDNQPKYILAAGILIDILLFYVIVSLYSVNKRAEKIAVNLTEEYRLAKEREVAANRAKSQFLANMSHELRTPLNSIIGFTQILQRKLLATLSEREREALDSVNRNGKHLLGLINDILDLSKVEAGRMDIDVSEFDLIACLAPMAKDWADSAEQKGLTLNYYSHIDSVAMQSDRRKILQITQNIISNAIKYTDTGSITIDISLEDRPCQQIRMQITDTGRGISKEDQQNLFNQYFRAESVRAEAIEGTGLGLVITANLVRLLGGEFTIDSDVGKGSVFEVLIPVVYLDNNRLQQSDAA